MERSSALRSFTTLRCCFIQSKAILNFFACLCSIVAVVGTRLDPELHLDWRSNDERVKPANFIKANRSLNSVAHLMFFPFPAHNER
jgi:hypothetical protein